MMKKLLSLLMVLALVLTMGVLEAAAAEENCPKCFSDENCDGICDNHDQCQGHPFADKDQNGVCDDCRPCQDHGFTDEDGNGICDHCDRCQGKNCPDADQDGVCDNRDGCKNHGKTVKGQKSCGRHNRSGHHKGGKRRGCH